MDMTRKITAILMIVVLMALPMAGCKKSSQTGEGSKDETMTSAPDRNDTDKTDDKSEDKTGVSTDVKDAENGSGQEGEAGVTEEPLENGGFRKASALVAAMNVGWNLGNTLESVGAGNTLSSETYWGNPKTTQEMIDAVAEEGFNTIRIPVTWAEHLGPAPDYKVDEKWMNRVTEVVDYAMNNNMFVILNTHHETEFWLRIDQDENLLCEELSAIWKQIAENFKDYPDNLIFEGMNEPRTKGSIKEWSGGTLEERKVINKLNFAFRDAVRESGGNNAYRSLIFCTYGHSPETVAISALELPENDENIIVAVHAYTPYFFTYDAPGGGYSEWSSDKSSDIKGFTSVLMQHFTLAGIPVVITEFGAVNKKNSADVVNWLTDYMTIMNRYGIKCIWWDNGQYTSNGENFGIFNRRKLEWFDKNIADALIANSVTETE